MTRHRSPAELKKINEYYNKKREELSKKIGWGWRRNEQCRGCGKHYGSIVGMFVGSIFIGSYCSVDCFEKKTLGTIYADYPNIHNVFDEITVSVINGTYCDVTFMERLEAL